MAALLFVAFIGIVLLVSFVQESACRRQNMKEFALDFVRGIATAFFTVAAWALTATTMVAVGQSPSVWLGVLLFLIGIAFIGIAIVCTAAFGHWSRNGHPEWETRR